MFTRRLSAKSPARLKTLVALGALVVLLGVGDLSQGFAALLGPALAPGDLKGRWRFDEGAGTTILDVSGNSNTGTLQNGAAWASAGPSGAPYALELDGVNDYVSIANEANFDFTGAFSVAFWMKSDGFTKTWEALVTKGDSAWRVHRHSSTNNVSFDTSGLSNVTLAGTKSVNDGQWHHVAAVYDGSTKKLYIDGIQSASASVTGTLATNNHEVRLGENAQATGRHFDGKMDEVRIYSRALAAGEVAGLAREGGALEVFYALDEGSGTTASDNSGNGNDGTLTNGPTWVAGQSGQALSFDGTDDYVTAGAAGVPAANAAQSVACFMNYASVPSAVQCAIGLTNDASSSAVQIGFRDSKLTVWKYGGTVLAQATAPSTGAWHHVAYTFDGTTHRLYIDGTEANNTTTAPQTAAPNKVELGRWSGGSEYYAGKLDDVRVYQKALSAAEVAGLVAGTGTGLAAVYYDNIDWTGTFVQRTDAQVNFQWGTGSPDPSIGADTFSAVWTGQVQPQVTELYIFYTNTDDGVRLWVDGKLIVDYPQDQAPTERTGQIQLTGGTKVNLRMEYFENGGGAVAELRWSSPSTPKALIPQSQLYPTDTVAPLINAATSSTADLTKVYVRFNEAMDKTTSETASNWTLSGGLTVSSVALSLDKRVVTVTASGNVTLGTTTVTASASILGITREALASPFTHTIVAGNNQGLPDSTAITLILTTDGNGSVIGTGTGGFFGMPQGVGETLRVVAQGTTATAVELIQVKAQSGKSEVFYGESGSFKALTVTTSGGSPNFAEVAVRHAVSGASKDDFSIRALVGTGERAVKPATAISISIAPKCAYMADQRAVRQVLSMTPGFSGVTFTSTARLVDFDGTGIGSPTTLLTPPGWGATDSAGQTTRTVAACGTESYVYGETGATQTSAAQMVTLKAQKREGWDITEPNPGRPVGPPHNYQYAGNEGSTSGYSTCQNSTPTDSGKSKSKDVASVDPRTGRSVDPTDGEKKLDVRDLVIRGRGLHYEFRRIYRSHNYRRALGRTKDFGDSWVYSYADDYLVKDGTGADSAANFLHFRDGSSGGAYVNIATGKWNAPREAYTRLRIHPVTADLEIRDQDGTFRVYHNFSIGTTPNKNGRLKELRDRNENKLTFHYEQIDPDNTVSGDERMVLAYVIDTMGREIRYRYYAKTAQTVNGRQVTEATTNAGALGRLFHIRDFKGNMDFDGTENPDFAGQDANRQVRFDYDAEGNLVMARSPIVLATPTGNNFPNGRTFRYKYIVEGDLATLVSGWTGFTSAQQDVIRGRLLHKLTHIWYPNEVKESLSTNPADADAAEVLTYNATATFSPAGSTLLADGTFLGYATSYTIGGTNGNGVPSGATISYTYTDLNPDRDMPPFPHNLFPVQSLRVDVVDRNGNDARYTYSGQKTLMEYKEFTLDNFRTTEPDDYTLVLEHHKDRIVKKATAPEGDIYEPTHNTGSSDRFQQGNIMRTRRTPGPRGGDQSSIEIVYVFEPIYNRPCLIVSARGSNSGANGFTSPIAEPGGHSRTMTDPYDATKTLNLRYAMVEFFDFQESPEKASQAPASRKDKDGSGGQVNASPLIGVDANVLTTEVWLVQILGVSEDSAGLTDLRARLTNNLTKLGLGDLNGDGDTTPAAAGNIIRTAYGSPVLLANLNQHAIESAIDGSDLIDQAKTPDIGGTFEGTQGARLQTIVWMYQYNAFGQMTKRISPDGNVTTLAYFPENNADGDTLTTPAPADGRTLDTSTGGYVKETLQDTTRNYVQQTTGSTLTGAFSNNNTNPAVTDIKLSYTYDDVGNIVTMTDGRGIRMDSFVNEIGETVQATQAADISGAASASPSDPLYNHSDTQQKLTAFAYKSRLFRDYNGNVVLSQTEDRGNTSSVDGSGLGTLPSQATGTTPGLSSADSSGGDAYADTLSIFDRLDNLIETRSEVDSMRSLNTRYRYDGNQHQVLVIYPEGNADSTGFDEREFVFQQVRGASSRPSAGKYASGDPTTFDRPGGSGTTPSTTTYNYDKDQNLVELVDAADTDGNSANNSTIAGGGDVVAKYTYDGYNRAKTMTDSLGNKATYLYDPDSNVIRVIQDGDPVDDLVGSGENKTLSVTETIHDELSRAYVTHRVLFQTPDASPTRTPVLTDTPGMDSLAAYLADASSDTASVPGSTGVTVIGRFTSITEYDRESRVTFQIQDDLDVRRTDYDGVSRGIKSTDDALSNGFSGGAYNPANISGNTVEMAYDDNSNVIEVKETDVTAIANVAAEVFRTTSLHDALDRLQTSFNNVGQTLDVRYDARGNRAAGADAVGSVSTRSFNRRGLGSTAAVTINDYGNVTRSTFDGLSRLLETETRLTSSGQGDGTNIGATLEGVKTTAPTVDTAQSGDGLISVYYAHDDNSQLLALRDDDGNVTGYLYDNQNRQKVERKGLGVTGTTFSLSGGDSGAFNVSLRGGVTPIDTESAGTDVTRTYDPDSNVTTLVDEAGNSFSCSYDALNRKKSCSITAASGFIGTRGTNAQTWEFDGLSRMTKCTDVNEPTPTADDVVCQYFYDSLSRKVEETQKIGSLSVRAVSCSFELDCACGGPAAGLASECVYPDGRRVHHLYDRLDRLVSRNDVEGTTQHPNIGTYEYIGKGRVAVLAYQNNVRLIHIGQVSSQNADLGFDGLRRIVNHRWESFTANPTPQALGAGTLVLGFEHQDGNSTPAPMYDRANNKRLEYKSHDPGNSEQYKYDSTYRLTSTGSGSQGQDARGFERGTFTNANRTSMAGGVGFFQDWDLEGLGNWSRQDDNARVETRTHSDFNEIVDRVVSGNTATLTHDKNGNTTDTGYTSLGGQTFPGGGLRLEWDALNRLRAVHKNNNTPGTTGDDFLVAEYTYDCQNRRMRKVVTNSGSLNGTTDFYYEGWRVLEERNGSDAVVRQYTYGNYLDEVWTLDNRVGCTIANLNDNTGTCRHFYLSNTLYHAYGLMNEGSSTSPGTLKEAYEYDVYGRQTVITDGNDTDTIVNFNANDVRTLGGASTINGSPFQFTGRRFDPESMLFYYRSRVYSAEVGRFLGRDPLIYSASYEYVGSSPASYVDPFGLYKVKFDLPQCIVELTFTIQLEWQGAWTVQGKGNFMRGLASSIESLFNGTAFRIFPARATYSYTLPYVIEGVACGGGVTISGACPCPNGWTPRVNILITDEWTWFDDWEVNAHWVAPGAPTPREDAENIYSSNTAGQLAHEFGHGGLGLQHPGFGQPGIAPNSPAEYAFTGNDLAGNPVGAGDLMGNGGLGTSPVMRPFYFDKWAKELDSRYWDCARHNVR